MGGITSGIGIFSGIDTRSLIDQLLAISARPKIFAQQRIAQLQVQQSSFLDINSRFSALSTASKAFRLENTFGAMSATSGNEDALTAVASPGALAGSFSFLVDRLVSSQQLLSKGFGDKDTSGIGATSFTFESADGRLDRDMQLADLNGGTGIGRGKIQITEGGGAAVEIDLSKAVTVSDVLNAINNNTSLSVTASTSGGSFVLESTQTLAISSSQGFSTAEDLGIAASSGAGVPLTGSNVFFLSASSSLSILNDGNGVFQDSKIIAAGNAKYDFQLIVDSPGGSGTQETINVNISDVWDFVNGEFEKTDSAVTNLGGVVTRINTAISDAGFSTDLKAQISTDGTRVEITRTDAGGDLQVVENGSTGGNTAADLGLVTTGAVTLGAGGTHAGTRLLAGLNSTLVSNLAGGGTDLGDGVINFVLRNGSSFTANVDVDGSVQELMQKIEADAKAALGSDIVSVTLDQTGTGIVVTDLSGGLGTLNISGTSGTNTALALNIETPLSGVDSDTVSSGSLQHRYLSEATLLSTLNHGRGVSTGTITITDSTGAQAEITIDSGDRSIGDVIKSINASGAIKVQARINDTGDGILLYETGGAIGQEITVTDKNGSVAKSLGIAGKATGDGANNFIDGSFETTVAFDPTDTLEDVARKINDAGADVTASVVNTGSGSNPFKLSLASQFSGTDGRFTLDTGALSLGLNTLETGRDAVVFFGGADPASAELLVSSTNTLDGILNNVTIDLKQTSVDPIDVTITRDNETIEGKVEGFVQSFNDLVSRIDFQTRYDDETEISGPLIGDSTMIGLRTALFNTVFGEAQNVTGTFSRLLEVGISVGSGGVLEFDRDTFREALETDAQSVEALFAERTIKPKTPEPIPGLPGNITVKSTGGDEFTSLGVVGQLEELARTYIDSIDGILTLRGQSLDNQIALQNRRIVQFDKQLDIRRSRLEQQFLAMERAIGQLQNQSGSLQSIGSIR
jgi:flagellar hook-associated protein 2